MCRPPVFKGKGFAGKALQAVLLDECGRGPEGPPSLSQPVSRNAVTRRFGRVLTLR